MKEQILKCPKCGNKEDIKNIDTVYVLHKEVTYQIDEWYIHNLKKCPICNTNIVV